MAERKRAKRLPAAQRREQILDAALNIAANDGIGEISMESVARGVGVAKTVVYDAFPHREALITSLLEREQTRALNDIAASFPRTAAELGPDELLITVAVSFLEAVHSHPDRWRLILIPPDGTPGSVREAIEIGRERVLTIVRPLIAWGIDRRGGPHLDPEITAHTLLALAENAARMTLRDPETFSVERLKVFAESVLAAIVAP